MLNVLVFEEPTGFHLLIATNIHCLHCLGLSDCFDLPEIIFSTLICAIYLHQLGTREGLRVLGNFFREHLVDFVTAVYVVVNNVYVVCEYVFVVFECVYVRVWCVGVCVSVCMLCACVLYVNACGV